MDKKTEELETIQWDTGVKGLRPVTLVPLNNIGNPPEEYPVPITVIRHAELEQAMQNEAMRILSTSGSGKEIAAAMWLEEQLDYSVSRPDCIFAIKKIRNLRAMGGRGKSINEQKVIVRMKKAFWTSRKDFELLKNVPGVFCMNQPGKANNAIESSIEWPKSENKIDPEIDGWMNQAGQHGQDANQAAGKLISVGTRSTSGVNSQMPSRQPGRPQIRRGTRS